MRVEMKNSNKVTTTVNEEDRCKKCLKYEYCIKRKDTEVCLEYDSPYIKI